MKARIKRIRKRLGKWIAAAKAKLTHRIHRHRKDTRERIEEVKASREQFRMFDSVVVTALPRDAAAVAGYVNGYYRTWPDVKRLFPNAKKLSIAVTSLANADCLDVEPGNASPADAPGWVKRQQKRGVKRPAVYCALSAAREVLAEIQKAGIKREEVRLWTAHYTHTAHLCGPSCGFGLNTTADATQFTDHSGGRTLDESLCRHDFI